MESEILPTSEYTERARAFANEVIKLEQQLGQQGMVLDGVHQESELLADEMESVGEILQTFDLSDAEREELKEHNRLIDADDREMTERGQDAVFVIIDDPQKREQALSQVMTNTLDPLAKKYSGTRVSESITDTKSSLARVKEILKKPVAGGEVKRLLARYKFTG